MLPGVMNPFFLVLLAPTIYCAKTPQRLNDGFKPPKWYHGYDGPIYGVMESRDNIEHRSYHPTVWASTNFSDTSFDQAYSQGVKRLDSYWDGKNVPEKEIASTVPTFIQMFPSPTGNRTVKHKWTVEYFVPHELHAKPPAPSAEEVNVIKLPQMEVWVKTFGGYAKEEDVINQAFDFFDDLKKAGVSVRKDLVGVAFYDKPYHVLGRHNEIWAWPKKEMSTEDIHEARAKLQHNMEAVLRQNIGVGA